MYQNLEQRPQSQTFDEEDGNPEFERHRQVDKYCMTMNDLG